MEKSICNAMDEFYRLVNSLPPTEASDALSRFAATKPIEVSIQALSRLYVLTFIQVQYVMTHFNNAKRAEVRDRVAHMRVSPEAHNETPSRHDGDDGPLRRGAAGPEPVLP